MTTTQRKAGFGPTFIGAALLVVTLGAGAVWFFRTGTPKDESYDDKRGAARLAKRLALDLEDSRKLSAYAITDKEKGIVQLPLERAFALTVAELKTKPTGPSSVKVDDPYPHGMAPAPAAAPAAQTAPAPAAEVPAAVPAPATIQTAPAMEAQP